MKKIFLSIAILVLISCKSNESPNPVDLVENNSVDSDLDWQFIIRVGTRSSSFDVYKVTIDSNVYIIGSEYKGGMMVIDKNKIK